MKRKKSSTSNRSRIDKGGSCSLPSKQKKTRSGCRYDSTVPNNSNNNHNNRRRKIVKARKPHSRSTPGGVETTTTKAMITATTTDASNAFVPLQLCSFLIPVICIPSKDDVDRIAMNRKCQPPPFEQLPLKSRKCKIVCYNDSDDEAEEDTYEQAPKRRRLVSNDKTWFGCFQAVPTLDDSTHWKCKICFVPNENSCTICIACETPFSMPTTTTAAATTTTTNVGTSDDATVAAVSSVSSTSIPNGDSIGEEGFSFGASSSIFGSFVSRPASMAVAPVSFGAAPASTTPTIVVAPSSATPAAPAFAFGSAAPAPVLAAGGFSFGGKPASTTAAPAFGAAPASAPLTAAGAPSATPAAPAFSFGSVAPVPAALEFSFGAAPGSGPISQTAEMKKIKLSEQKQIYRETASKPFADLSFCATKSESAGKNDG